MPYFYLIFDFHLTPYFIKNIPCNLCDRLFYFCYSCKYSGVFADTQYTLTFLSIRLLKKMRSEVWL